jgi:hypothetical protein
MASKGGGSLSEVDDSCRTTGGTTYVLALVMAGDAVRTLGTLLYIKRQPRNVGFVLVVYTVLTKMSIVADATRIRSGTPSRANEGQGGSNKERREESGEGWMRRTNHPVHGRHGLGS